MHEELIGLLTDLLSSDGADDEAIAFPYGFNEWFNEVDDLLPDGAESASGAVLYPSEVEPVAMFLQARDAIWRELGRTGTFRQYRQHPRRLALIDTARLALAAMGGDPSALG